MTTVQMIMSGMGELHLEVYAEVGGYRGENVTRHLLSNTQYRGCVLSTTVPALLENLKLHLEKPSPHQPSNVPTIMAD